MLSLFEWHMMHKTKHIDPSGGFWQTGFLRFISRLFTPMRFCKSGILPSCIFQQRIAAAGKRTNAFTCAYILMQSARKWLTIKKGSWKKSGVSDFRDTRMARMINQLAYIIYFFLFLLQGSFKDQMGIAMWLIERLTDS